MKVYTDIVASAQYKHLCATLSQYDDGTGDLGTIIAQALIDDPDATVEAIAAVIDEARADGGVKK